MRSDNKGKFLFEHLTPGKYTLVPFFQSKATKYEVVPKELEVKIGHNDFHIEEPFKVII